MSKMSKTPIALTPYVRDPYYKFYEEDNKAFLEIGEEKKPFIENLFNNQSLPQAKLNKEKSIIEYEKFALPIKNKDIPPTMKKEMSLVYLKTAELLDEKGLTPTGADFLTCHINTNSEPFYKDFSSTSKITSNCRFPLFDFINKQYAILLTCSRYPKLVGLTRSDGLLDIDDFITINHRFFNWFLGLILPFLSNKNIKRVKKLAAIYPLLYRNKLSPLNIIEVLRFVLNKDRKGSGVIKILMKDINSIPSFDFSGKWTNYYDGIDLDSAFSEKANWKKYFEGDRAKSIISALAPDRDKNFTLLDTGSNRGYFSLIGANLGYNVRAIDYDVASIDLIFRSLKEEKYRHSITPMVVDFSNLDAGDFKRFKSDYVLALGFTHHLYYVEGYSWAQISEVFANLTDKVFITEFKPNTKGRSSKSISSRDNSDYDLEEFKKALEKDFSEVKAVSEHTAQLSNASRILLIAKK